jgi:hypothetical protein
MMHTCGELFSLLYKSYVGANMSYERCRCGASRFACGGRGTWYRRTP